MISSFINTTIVAAALSTAAINGLAPSPSTPAGATPILASDSNPSASASQRVFSAKPTAPGELDKALSGLYAELEKGADEIQAILDGIRDLSSTTKADAERAADHAIGIGDRIDGLLEDGGPIEEAVRNAEAYFRGVGEIIAKNDMLSESQRNELLDIINSHQRDLTLEANRLLEMRRTIQALVAKARQSREYVAMAFMAHTGERIVEDIQQLTMTLAAMAASLRELTSNADTAAL